MTRVEENEIMLNAINEKVERRSYEDFESYKEMSAFNLGIVVASLIDISKSLAVIADKMGERK